MAQAQASESNPEYDDFTVIWAAPILPGQSEAWRRFIQETVGDRRQSYENWCRRLGIRAMRVWITETAQGHVGVIAVAAYAMLVGLGLANAISAVITLIANIAGLFNVLGWSGPVLFVVLAAGCGYFLLGNRGARQATPA